MADEPLVILIYVELKKVEYFKYPGSWVKATDTDFKVRKAIACKVLNQMKNVWYSRLSQVKLFLATEESVLMYGSVACTMTEKLTKAIDDVASGWFS